MNNDTYQLVLSFYNNKYNKDIRDTFIITCFISKDYLIEETISKFKKVDDVEKYLNELVKNNIIKYWEQVYSYNIDNF